MCEYCGCQDVPAIAELTREHDSIVSMIRDADVAIAGADPATAAAVARRITAALEPHTAVEERGLFPALAAEYPEPIDGLLAEHRRIESVLAEAAVAVPVDPLWPARLTEVLHLLRDHILKEQDGVFPAALISLGPDDWDHVERVRAAVTEGGGARLDECDRIVPG